MSANKESFRQALAETQNIHDETMHMYRCFVLHALYDVYETDPRLESMNLSVSVTGQILSDTCSITLRIIDDSLGPVQLALQPSVGLHVAHRLNMITDPDIRVRVQTQRATFVATLTTCAFYRIMGHQHVKDYCNELVTLLADTQDSNPVARESCLEVALQQIPAEILFAEALARTITLEEHKTLIGSLDLCKALLDICVREQGVVTFNTSVEHRTRCAEVIKTLDTIRAKVAPNLDVTDVVHPVDSAILIESSLPVQPQPSNGTGLLAQIDREVLADLRAAAENRQAQTPGDTIDIALPDLDELPVAEARQECSVAETDNASDCSFTDYRRFQERIRAYLGHFLRRSNESH